MLQLAAHGPSWVLLHIAEQNSLTRDRTQDLIFLYFDIMSIIETTLGVHVVAAFCPESGTFTQL